MFDYGDNDVPVGYRGSKKRPDHIDNTIYILDIYNNILEEVSVDDAPSVLEMDEVFEVLRDIKGGERRFKVVGYININNHMCYLLEKVSISQGYYRNLLAYHAEDKLNGKHSGKNIIVMPMKVIGVPQIDSDSFFI